MTMNPEQYIIKDPIYGTIIMDEQEHDLIRSFIDHPLLQRLRHIKQLSFVDLIFPGAVHTRFNHSLGCSYLCSRMYKQLYPQENSLNDDHKLIILAGLLHDIGHGPFSHAFEHVGVFKEKNIKHEEWFPFFVKEMFDSIDDKQSKKVFSRLMQLFSQDYSGLPWIKSAISSQIDADRMDYMLRDSHFCGVKYGVYDLDWLLSCFALDDNQGLIITEKGIGSAEQFLHARQLMHKNVYYNIKSNAISHCVIDFLDSLIYEVDAISKIIPNSRLIKFVTAIEQHKGLPKTEFMQQIYNEYKILVDYDIWYAIREIAISSGNSVCHQLARRLYNRELPIACRIKASSVDFVKELVDDRVKKAHLKAWQIKVITDSVCFYENSKQPVFVVDGMGVKRQLQDSSTTISNVSNQRDAVCFLYIDKAAYNDKHVKDIIKECNQYAAFIYE